MGAAHDCDLVDAGIARDGILDFARVHVEARHDDEILRAVDEVEVTLVVGDRDVTGAEPSV